MSHTKELTIPQFLPRWDCEYGNEIGWRGIEYIKNVKICPECNGQGGRMTTDRFEAIEMCQTCEYTGRVKD